MRLERYERSIIIFLIAVILAGITWNLWTKIHSRVDIRVERFDLQEDEEPSGTLVGVGLININEASLDELMRLKRVGKVLARRIIDYRSSSGRFRTKEEIKNVKGIGDNLYEDIKEKISVE